MVQTVYENACPQYLPHAVGKHVRHVKLHCLHERQRVLVLLLSLPTEPRDEVRGEGHVCRAAGSAMSL